MAGNKLKQVFDRARLASERRNTVLGVLGRTPTDTPAQCVVASDPGMLWVRIGTGTGQSVSEARNPGTISVRANTPVEMTRKNGQLVILGYDLSSSALFVATGGDTLNQYGIPPHTHKIGSGLEYEIESLRLEPGRVHCDDHTMTATINGFRHEAGTWASGTIDLTAFIPTSGLHRWVLVGVNPATNTAVAAATTPVSTGTTLTIAGIDAIDFGDYIPLGAYQVSFGDTELAQYAYEARRWFTPAVPAVTDMVVFDDEFVFFGDEVVTV